MAPKQLRAAYSDAPTPAPASVDLVWFNAGGGHRAAALALERTIVAMGFPWQVRRVNLTEVLDPEARFKRLFAIEPEAIYNKRLATGFTYGLTHELRMLQLGIRVAHDGLVRRLERYWSETTPDLVVSLIPNFNRALHDALALARPGVPFVTVMTDMADCPPHFWIEPEIDQHVICGTGHAVTQAASAGVRRERIHEVAGMILRPEFYASEEFDRAAQRRELGIHATAATGLVLFGGTGSKVMKRIAERLPRTPLILMCGSNDRLAAELSSMRAAAARIVVGFTPDVPRWMRLADFLIGKPGPGSLSEAVQQGLPVIVTRNAATMPQERWNTEWVHERGIGIVHRSFRTVQEAVDEITANLPEYRANVARVKNRAVFEIPNILASILEGAAAPEGARERLLRFGC